MFLSNYVQIQTETWQPKVTDQLRLQVLIELQMKLKTRVRLRTAIHSERVGFNVPLDT